MREYEWRDWDDDRPGAFSLLWKFMRILGILFVVLLAGLVGVLALLSGGTEIKLQPAVKAIGTETPVNVQLVNSRGVRAVAAFVEQDGARHKVFEQENPDASRLFFWRRNDPPRDVKFTAGKKQAPALKEGKARLVVSAQSNDLLAKTTDAAWDVDVITRPPTLSVDGAQHYINQGGSELVTFTVSGYWTEAGVRVGKYTFRSFPLAGNENERFSLFAYPWDVPPGTVPVVYARNPAGTEVQGRFWHKVFPKSFRKRDLELPDTFIDKVINEIDAGGSGDRVQRFLKINGEMRRQNNQTLADLRLKTEPRFLWSGPFVQLSNSKVESQFADTRSYLYQGKKIDEQTHLGFDLSVTANVPVAASNDGRVVLAENLGIYGNCVVVDHGYGLQSIYAHLSKIDVKPGDAVKKGQTVGKSGATGLAGGDHLHFSMQVDGVQVNPVEWWDGHWIQDRILSKVRGSTPAPK
ncbi:MAG: M23 family metallopeptidase [Bryobacteraceae bacterium]|nr:M23 family metallopeptidase [Bryobacteraceae bacterium]